MCLAIKKEALPLKTKEDMTVYKVLTNKNFAPIQNDFKYTFFEFFKTKISEDSHVTWVISAKLPSLKAVGKGFHWYTTKEAAEGSWLMNNPDHKNNKIVEAVVPKDSEYYLGELFPNEGVSNAIIIIKDAKEET